MGGAHTVGVNTACGGVVLSTAGTAAVGDGMLMDMAGAPKGRSGNSPMGALAASGESFGIEPCSSRAVRHAARTQSALAGAP